MLAIKFITVGKLKEKYLKLGIDEYAKRLQSFCKLEIVEVPDEKAGENLSFPQMEAVKNKEGEKVLARIKDDEYVFVLAIKGELPSSEELAEDIRQLGIQGKSKITFVIGGSLGTSDAVNKRANKAISFGRMTFPHQLMRLILIEQVYRSLMINNGQGKYHK